MSPNVSGIDAVQCFAIQLADAIEFQTEQNVRQTEENIRRLYKAFDGTIEHDESIHVFVNMLCIALRTRAEKFP